MSSTLISVSPCWTPGVLAHDALRLIVDICIRIRREKANGQLEKTAGPSSQRLAQQCPGGCRRYTAVYAVEIGDRQERVTQRLNGLLLDDDDDEKYVCVVLSHCVNL